MTALEIIGMILLLFLLLSLLRVGAIVDFGGARAAARRSGQADGPAEEGKESTEEGSGSSRENAGGEDKAEGGGRTPPAEAQLSRAARACGDGARRAEADASPHLPPHAHRPAGGRRDFCGRRSGGHGADLRLCQRRAVDSDAEARGAVLYPEAVRLSGDGLHKGGENSAEGTVGVSLRVCDLFAILFTLAVPVGKWFLRWRRAHGGEAKAEPPAERAAVPKTNEPEKRTA